METIGTHNYYIYILTNRRKTVLYTGLTNNLRERLHYHQNPDALSRSFTAKYRCYYLVYYEHYQDINIAIQREKQIKGWKRNKKVELINSYNPEWKFLNWEI